MTKQHAFEDAEKIYHKHLIDYAMESLRMMLLSSQHMPIELALRMAKRHAELRGEEEKEELHRLQLDYEVADYSLDEYFGKYLFNREYAKAQAELLKRQ